MPAAEPQEKEKETEKEKEAAASEPEEPPTYSNWVELSAGSIFLKGRLATLYFSAGDLNNAVHVADQIPPADVRDGQTLLMLAGIYAGAGQADRALALYDQAIDLNPTGSDAYFSKGVLLVNLMIDLLLAWVDPRSSVLDN